MAKRLWESEPNIEVDRNRYRIRIRRKGKLVVDEVISTTDVAQREKTDLERVKKIRDEYLAKLQLNLPLHDHRNEERRQGIVDTQPYMSFGDAIDVFLDRGLKSQSDRTFDDYRKILENKWLPVFSEYRLNEITKQVLEDYLYERKREGRNRVFVRDWSNKYRKNLLGPLSKLFNYFEISPNPTTGVLDTKSADTRGKRRFKPYKPLEIRKLLDRLDGDAKYYFQFAFATGMRHQEILALRWSDISDGVACVERCISNYVLVGRVKTDLGGRQVTLNAAAMDALNKLHSRWQKGFVFPQPNGDYYKKPKRFREQWIKAHEKSGVEYRQMKTTRHTRATELLSVGVNPAKAARQLGHDKETFLKTYADYMPDYDEGSDDLLESAFAAL